MLTAERLRELITYDPDTGTFRWLTRTSNRAKVGNPAGSLNKTLGYRSIGVDGRRYWAHRLAFLWMLGRWPNEIVDHRNGNGDDNSWANLREANKSQNAANSTMRKDNTIGLRGVYRNHNRWASRIRVGGKLHYLGTFDTKEQAYAAYIGASGEHFGEFSNF